MLLLDVRIMQVIDYFLEVIRCLLSKLSDVSIKLFTHSALQSLQFFFDLTVFSDVILFK